MWLGVDIGTLIKNGNTDDTACPCLSRFSGTLGGCYRLALIKFVRTKKKSVEICSIRVISVLIRHMCSNQLFPDARDKLCSKRI